MVLAADSHEGGLLDPAQFGEHGRAAQFRLDLVRVGEVRIPPVDGVPDRRVEPAFAHGLILGVFKKARPAPGEGRRSP